MPTGNDIVQSGFEIAGVISPGETLATSEQTMGLKRLNSMLDSWQTDRMYVYQILTDSITLTTNDGTYTIGSGGDKNTNRPLKIVDPCYVRESNTDYPVKVIEAQEYGDIVSKSTVTSNYPFWLYYDPAYPLGIINLYPVPSATNTLFYSAWQVLQSFTSGTANLALPDGFQEAIEYSLAERFAGIYSIPFSPENRRTAAGARRRVKAINSRPIIAKTDFNQSRSYNIRADS